MAGLLSGGGLRGHGELPLNADINVTSLVDVAFVLLIIFMITAPIMQGGVDVRLPRAEARPLEPKTGLVVTVDQSGRIFLDQAPLSYEDFRATFGAAARPRRESPRSGPAHDAPEPAAPRRDAVDRQRRRDGEHRRRRVPLPGVSAEHRLPGAAPLAAAAAEHAARGGGLVLRAPGRVGDGPAIHPALGELRLRPRGAGRDRRRRQGIWATPGRVA